MNKPSLKAFFTVLINCAVLAVAAQSNIDVLHYKFELQLTDRTDSIKGKASITVKFTDAGENIWLNLASPDGKGKGMTVDKVLEGNTSLKSTQQKDTLSISLAQTAQKNVTRTIEIYYSGIPFDGLIISKNKYGDRTFFADNWPNRAHDWIPCKDEPDDKASFEFIVTAPAKYSVISNGKKEEEKMLGSDMKLTHWSEEVSLSTKVMVIGVAKFAVKKFTDGPEQIPVTAWTYPQDSATGFANYSVAPEILRFYQNYIGPYPYNKLANVESRTIFGGMENASSIFYYEESAELHKSMEDLLAHEIAHQWFGDMASEKDFSQLWLSEGFATYMTDVYLESKYGRDSMNRRLDEERKTVISFAKRSNHAVVDARSPLMDLLNANSYQKGAWVLHMLRAQWGDTLFQKLIATYYDRFKGSNANTGDFEKVAEEVSHSNLDTFFRQWLYTPGIPNLHVQWLYREKEKKLEVRVDQLQQQPAFVVTLQIKLDSPDGSKIISLHLSQRSELFSIPVTESVTNVILDPNTVLLFEGDLSKIGG